MFEIINSDELLRRLSKYNHKALHVHHTYKPSHKDFNGSNGIELQINMRNYHVNNKGWSDIGQHVTLLPNGLFVTGRDFGRDPASIAGWNKGAFACEMLGNFNLNSDVLQGEQKASILKLARYFYDKNREILFHREKNNTDCPGYSLDKNTFMSEVKGLNNIPQAKPQPVPTKEPKTWELNINGQIIKDLQHELNVQYAAGIKEDGWAGDITIDKLPIVRYGAKGNITRIIQKLILSKGYNLPKYGADGSYGGEMKTAVLQFQGDNRLSADGDIGPNTWKALLRK